MAVFKDIVLPTLTVATPVLVALATVWTEHRIGQVDDAVRAQRLEIASLEETRRERESLQDYNLEVLKEVKEALATNDEIMQGVVIGLLSSMPNRDLADVWLEAIVNSGQSSPAVKDTASAARSAVQFDREQEQTAFRAGAGARVFDWEDYDYDIFWCEVSGDAAQRVAVQIEERLRQEDARGRLRVRPLPESVNARPGYQVSGFEIRPNPDELEQGQALQLLGNQVLGESGEAFDIRVSTTDTPYYLSAFVCP